MKTTKCLAVIITIGLTASNIATVKAQGAYLQVSTGYGFGSNSFLLGRESTDNSSQSGSSGTDKVLNVSLGKGLNFGVDMGYMFNNNVGMELGIGYLMGSKIMVSKYTSTSQNSTDKRTEEWQSSSLRFTPAFKVAGEMGNIRPYTKFGIVVGVMNNAMSFENREETSSGITTKTVEETKITGKMSLGFLGCAGIAYNMSEKMMLYLESNLLAQSFTPSKSVITKSETDGKDNLASMKTREKERVFEDEVSYSSSSPQNDSEPRKSLAYSLPFSSIGFNIGLQIGF